MKQANCFAFRFSWGKSREGVALGVGVLGRLGGGTKCQVVDVLGIDSNISSIV
jgi:hypothetical protein